jgi:hypothetical protein
MSGEYLKGVLKRGPEVKWEKPCHKLGFCPYGSLVEEFPLDTERPTMISCEVFGHNCPVFYCAEDLSEDTHETRKEVDS